MGRDFACQDSPQESLKTFHVRVRTPLKSQKEMAFVRFYPFKSTRLRASESDKGSPQISVPGMLNCYISIYCMYIYIYIYTYIYIYIDR